MAIKEQVGTGLGAIFAAGLIFAACSPQTQQTTPATATPSATLLTLGKLTLSPDLCELEAGGPFASGRVTIRAINRGNVLATFTIFRLLDGHTYAEARAHVDEDRRRLDAGETLVGAPPYFQSQGDYAVYPGETTTPTLTLLPGTFAIVCKAVHPRDQQLSLVSATGPLEVK